MVMTECTNPLEQELRAQCIQHKAPDDLMAALYIACSWPSTLAEIWFPQHHTTLQLQLTYSTEVWAQTYFSAGLKYFKNVFPRWDTASFWHSITTLIPNLDFHTKHLQMNHRLHNQQGINLFLYSNISNMCKPTLRPTQSQTDTSSF